MKDISCGYQSCLNCRYETGLTEIPNLRTITFMPVLCLSLMVALIYSGAVLITFIFVVMTFDQSDILCIPSYKFIPLLVLYIEGFIP